MERPAGECALSYAAGPAGPFHFGATTGAETAGGTSE